MDEGARAWKICSDEVTADDQLDDWDKALDVLLLFVRIPPGVPTPVPK